MGNIITPNKYYKASLEADWAVGGFIGYNMEIMQASAQAAVDVEAPVMIQASCRVVRYAGARMLRKMAEACAEMMERDIVLHLDHGDSVELCMECIDSGFTSVMLDNEFDSFEKNVEKTKRICDYAHARGAVVEGEVFHPIEGPDKYWTDVEEAEEYARLTGCDSLAFCCGNAHDLPEDHPRKLHTDQIARIHRALPEMPLVLHGTSILSPEFVDRVNRLGGNLNQPYNFTLEEIQESFKNGVCKVNSALDIKLVYTSAVKEFMLENPTQFDPRKYLGHARQAAREYIAWKHRTVFMDDGRY